MTDHSDHPVPDHTVPDHTVPDHTVPDHSVDDRPVPDHHVGPLPSLPRTGDAAVDEALDDLADVTSRPLEQQVEAYVGAHRRLQDRLADLDG